MKKAISPKVLAVIVENRDFDALLALVQPFVDRRGRRITVNKKQMTKEELRKYNREMQARLRKARQEKKTGK